MEELEMGFIDRLQHGWNAFMNKDPTNYNGYGCSYRPDRIYATRGNYRSIVNAQKSSPCDKSAPREHGICQYVLFFS